MMLLLIWYNKKIYVDQYYILLLFYKTRLLIGPIFDIFSS